MKSLVFSEDTKAFDGADTYSVKVPPFIADKSELFSWFALALRFPDYFGENWDALSECLRDLTSIREHRIVIFHVDLPLKQKQLDCRTYLNVLAHTVEDWKEDESHEFVALFHPSCESRIQELFKSEYRNDLRSD